LRLLIKKNKKRFAISIGRVLENEKNSINFWNNTGSHTEILLKINAIEFMCRFQEEDCLNKASELFRTIPEEFFTNPNNQTNP
jgi:hypothetical protein